MTAAEAREAFLADYRRAKTQERRETILTIWTARLCAEARVGQIGENGQRIRAELIAIAEEQTP